MRGEGGEREREAEQVVPSRSRDISPKCFPQLPLVMSRCIVHGNSWRVECHASLFPLSLSLSCMRRTHTHAHTHTHTHTQSSAVLSFIDIALLCCCSWLQRFVYAFEFRTFPRILHISINTCDPFASELFRVIDIAKTFFLAV